MTNNGRRTQAQSAAVFLALLVSHSLICNVFGWSATAPKAKTTTTPPPPPPSSDSASPARRSFLSTTAVGLVVLSETAVLAGDPRSALAAAEEEEASAGAAGASSSSSYVYTRKQTVMNDKKDLSYQISMPSSMKEGSKPVKTHLDEVNFVSDSVKRYQYGITVDPVRITSLKEFGTPEEVAARVVTAEVNRDGIFEVTLLEDPYRTKATENDPEAYILRYLSVGKRGNKVLTNKIVVSENQLLYVLTAQCRQDDFAAQEPEIRGTVESFRIN